LETIKNADRNNKVTPLLPSLPRRGYRGGYDDSTPHLNPLPMRGEEIFEIMVILFFLLFVPPGC
jgi:hypothetical protein